MKNIEVLFKELITKLYERSNPSFTGIGLLLYSDIKSVNQYHCNLVNSSTRIPDLHISSDELVRFLADISTLDHPYHDGFHFINQDGYLTHVAQFLSPPIDKGYMNIHGQGARTLCSINGSTIHGVTMVATISSKRDIFIFKNGCMESICNMKKDRLAML